MEEEEAMMGIGSMFAMDVVHPSDPHLGFSDRRAFSPQANDDREGNQQDGGLFVSDDWESSGWDKQKVALHPRLTCLSACSWTALAFT